MLLNSISICNINNISLEKYIAMPYQFRHLQTEVKMDNNVNIGCKLEQVLCMNTASNRPVHPENVLGIMLQSHIFLNRSTIP